MSETELPTIDIETMQKSYGDDKEFLRSLLSTAVGEVQSLLPKLTNAIDQQEQKDVFRLAHTIQGSARAVFAASLRESAVVVERLAHKGDLQSAKDCMQTLTREAERFAKMAREF